MRHRSGVLVVGHALSAFWACGALALGAVSAQAQSRPYAATFAGPRNMQTSGQTLDLTVSLAEAYDANILSRTGTGTLAGPAQQGGFFSELSGDTRFLLTRRRAQLSVNLGTNLRYLPEFNEVKAVGHYLTAGTSLELGSKSTLSATQSISYMPAYLPSFGSTAPPTATAPPPTVPSYAFTNRQSYTSMSVAQWNRRVGRHSSFDIQGSYRRTDYTQSSSGLGDLTSYDGGFRYNHGVGRDLTMRLGYIYREAQYSTGLTPHQHDIGVGLDYNRPLSRSRNTWLGFTFGSTILDALPPGRATGQVVHQFRGFADGTLTHQFGRTWSARGNYRRGAQFIDEVAQPVYSDSVTLSLDGFLSRRTEWTSSAVYSSGDLAARPNSGFKNYAANARLRYGLNKKWAAFGEYFYYRYEYQPGALPVTLPSRVNRNGARVGISTWLPIIGR
jgi:hypothetical protein